MRISILLLLAALARAADPSLIDLVMPDARMVLGIHVGRLLNSPAGRALQAQAQKSDPEFQKIVAAIGFDPARDLEEVLIASTAAVQNPPVLFLARGKFDGARLLAFAKASGAAIMEDQGVAILTGGGKQKGALAILDGTLAVGGDLAQVRAAIRRRGLKPELSAGLRAKVSALSGRYDIWAASLNSVAALASRVAGPQDDALKSIEEFSAGVRFSPDLDLTAELRARTDQDAAKLADGLRLMTSLAAKSQPQQSETLQRLNCEVQGRTIRLSWLVPEAELKQAMQAWQQKAAEARQPAASRANPRVPPNAEIVVHSSPKDMGTVVIPKRR